MLQLLNLVALQVDELEHLEVLFLVLAENPQQLLEVRYLCRSLNLRKVLAKLLDLLHLLRRSLCLPMLKYYFTLFLSR